MADTVAKDPLISDSEVVIELVNDPLIDFEATPEFRQQFRVWKNAKLNEVLAYLHNNWGLEEVTLDRLVMMPQFVLPDRKNRNLYGQVAPGQTFTDPAGNVVLHPVTSQPMIFTVWRRVDPPAAAIEEMEAPATADDAKAEIELAQPTAAAAI